MSHAREQLVSLYRRAANGNPWALDFLLGWHEMAHQIDDLVDEHPTPAAVVASHMGALFLGSSPFWKQHSEILRTVSAVIAATYLDSVMFERGGDNGLKEYGNALRLCGNDMVLAVAFLCGGWPNVTAISRELRQLSWRNQNAL